MLEREQTPARIDHHADGVEAKFPGARTFTCVVSQPGPRQAPDPQALAWLQPIQRDRLPAVAGPGGARGLDLREHERVPVAGDQVDLSFTGPHVALQHTKPEPPEVGRGQLLAEGSEASAGVHPLEARRGLGCPRTVRKPDQLIAPTIVAGGARCTFLIACPAMTTPPPAEGDTAADGDRDPVAPPGPSGPGGGPRSLDDLTSFIGLRWEDPETVRVTIRPELINRGGLLSGVVSFALVDYCMGSTLWAQTTEHERIATISISINYVQTATEGDVICRSTLNRRNRSIGVMQSEVRHEDGRLLATAIGSYSIFPPKAHLEDAAVRARSRD